MARLVAIDKIHVQYEGDACNHVGRLYAFQSNGRRT